MITMLLIADTAGPGHSLTVKIAIQLLDEWVSELINELINKRVNQLRINTFNKATKVKL